METNLREIETDCMLELFLVPWSTLKIADVKPKHYETAGKVANLLLKTKRFDALENFVSSLPEDVQKAFLEDETFRRVMIHLRHRQERFEDVCDLIRSGRFSQGEDLVDIWDEAHYYIWKKQHADRPLTSLLRFRIRKRNPPPISICSDGRRPSRSLDQKVRTLLSTWFQDNVHAPYPSLRVREEIAQKTGLTGLQIRNWFSNARRRTKQKKGQQQVSRSMIAGLQCSYDENTKDIASDREANSRNPAQASRYDEGLGQISQQLVEADSAAVHPLVNKASLSDPVPTMTTSSISNVWQPARTASRPSGLQGLLLMYQPFAQAESSGEHSFTTRNVSNDHLIPTSNRGNVTHTTAVTRNDAQPFFETVTLWSAPCGTARPPLKDTMLQSSFRLPCPYDLQIPPHHFIPCQQSSVLGNWGHVCVSRAAHCLRNDPACHQMMVSQEAETQMMSIASSVPEASRFSCHFTGMSQSSHIILPNLLKSEVGRESKSQEMPEPAKPCFGSPHSIAVSSATVNIASPPFSSPEPLFSPLLQANTDSSQEQPSFDGRSTQQLQQKAVFNMAESAGDIESPYIGRDNTFLPEPELQASWTVLPLVSTFSSGKPSTSGLEVIASDHLVTLPAIQLQETRSKRKEAEEMAAHILLNMAVTNNC